MFTGIVSHFGRIENITDKGKEKEIVISVKTEDRVLEIGQSVACDGICLTITKIDKQRLSFFVSHETLNKTIVRNWQSGDIVNIEFAMSFKDLFNGHIVTGHVDTIAKVKKITDLSDSRIVEFELDNHLEYLISKGSVTINGVSLTINEILDNSFEVNVIPHTWDNTNISNLEVGDEVNIEVDMIAKYMKKYHEKTK